MRQITYSMMKKIICLVLFTASFFPLLAQRDSMVPVVDTIAVQDTTKPAFTKISRPVNGLAAIYPASLDGSKTASGEVFLNIRLTAAYNALPLNTWVLVTNPKNKRSVILRINDRISKRQAKSGTVINLSREAAKNIGVTRSNSIKVKIEKIVSNDSLSKSNDTILKVDSLAPNTFRPKGKAINGIASFYSANLDGTLTATGDRYRNNKLTAASNNFKLNTWVLVTNLRNQKSVIVIINDRMHPRMKKKGRVVDLSRAAARELDFMEQGLTKVKVQPVEFVFSPQVKGQQDSLKTVTDSLTTTDSVKTVMEETNTKMGIASFYSPGFDGKKTATGDIFRNSRLSAASNDFDLNTWVRVTNLDNNKSVVLRINDRMHPRMQKKGRVVDLSRLAAKKLDFIKKGLTKVKVEVVPEGTVE